MEATIRQDQFTGSIVGLAVGDALGFPAEFRSREQMLLEFGSKGITDFVTESPHLYTDDTQMSIAVARGLLDVGDKNLDTLMTEIGRQFVRWSESADNNRAPGRACMAGCANLKQGAAWRAAGIESSKGCGSAMRVSPIGLYYEDLDRVVEVARASSLLTHGHNAALEGAASAALLVALALRGSGPQDMYTEIQSRCFGRSPDFDRCLAKVPAMVDKPPEEVLVKGMLGEGWVAEEAVASALYCVWAHPDDYRRAVLTAVNTDGDSDSIAAITGSIMGARLGIDEIPKTWRESVENPHELLELGQLLWKARRASKLR